MVETAALLVDDVLPRQRVRQWVLSLPFALRYLLATRPEVTTQVLGIVWRAISGHRIRKAGLTRASAVTGAVTLIQKFGSALNLNVHLHMLVLGGVYRRDGEGRLRFVPVQAPSLATGPREGQVFTLQTIPASPEGPAPGGGRSAHKRRLIRTWRFCGASPATHCA